VVLAYCTARDYENKHSAVAEMGNRLATTDMGRKEGAAVPLLGEREAGSPILI